MSAKPDPPPSLSGPLQHLKKIIETNEMERRVPKEYMFSTKPPKPIVSKKISKARPNDIDIRDLDPLEVFLPALSTPIYFL